MTSLYVHIPFCLKKCLYCDFVSGIYDPQKAAAYIDALKQEVQSIPCKPGLSTLYIGGGTPTALSSGMLSDLVGHIFRHIDCIQSHAAASQERIEASIEANPGTLDKEKLGALRVAGINRLSIGVQSFDDNELAFLGRIHSPEEAEQAAALARHAGFENIGLDIIYGIPGQDIESWKKTLEKTIRLKPEHISTYELTVEKGTLLDKYLMGHPLPDPLPPEDAIFEMYEYTIAFLKSSGYIHYEISNFALPGYECRHNLNYWDRGEYYGAGLGAHSFINNKRFHNTDNLEDYLRTLNEGKKPVAGMEDITEDKALAEAVFLGLRKTGGISLEAFSKRYSINILTRFEKQVKELQEAGLIEITESGCAYESNLRLTGKGLLLSNEVAARFL